MDWTIGKIDNDREGTTMLDLLDDGFTSAEIQYKFSIFFLKKRGKIMVNYHTLETY